MKSLLAGVWSYLVLNLAVGLGVLAWAAAEKSDEGEAVVLDWTGSYWRYILCLRSPEFSPPFTDNKGRTVRYLNHQRGWHIGYTSSRIRVAEIPEGWMEPDHDDETWVKTKGGFREGSSWYDQSVRVACVRGRFWISDPRRVERLRLSMKYMGGVVVYLNGVEVARQHLPEGPLTGDTMADPYPAETYEWGIPLNRHNYPAELWEWQAPNEKAERFRILDLDLDPRRLTRGLNVLAFALHRAGYGPPAAKWNYEAMNGYRNTPWPHFAILDLRLCVSPAPSVLAPVSSNLVVWAEDIHRQVVNRDTPEMGLREPVLRIVGAKNGTYSAQAVLWANRDIENFSASIGDLLADEGSGKIPASAASISFGSGLPLAEIVEPKFGRHQTYYTRMATRLLEAHGFGNGFRFKNMEARANPSRDVHQEARAIFLFDGLTQVSPLKIAARNCLPVWLTLRISREVPPGLYRGSLLVTAGGEEKKVEVRVCVVDWTLPEPRDFVTFVGLQQWLWAPCARYGCRPWSEQHWQKLERSTQLLGEVGNDLLVLPLVVSGEAANDESLVAWIKQGNGYECDWTKFDRYLDLVRKYWGTNVAVVGEICWVPRTEKGWVVRQEGVTVVENGVPRKLELPPPGSAEWAALFLPFARSVVSRVREKGFSRLYWGWFYDGIPEELEAMATALWADVPEVGWARASHNGFGNRPFPNPGTTSHLDIRIRGFRECFTREGEPASQMGWQNLGSVLFPRIASQIQAIAKIESPMAMRWLPENCIVNGASGFGRLGADFWPPFEFSNWYHPFQNWILSAGPAGAERTVRFEALREGLQEAEVRIRLEMAGLHKQEPVKSLLAARLMCIGALPTGADSEPMCAYYGGWQQRSWDLYCAAAAAFGGKTPSDHDRHRFFSPTRPPNGSPRSSK